MKVGELGALGLAFSPQRMARLSVCAIIMNLAMGVAAASDPPAAPDGGARPTPWLSVPFTIFSSQEASATGPYASQGFKIKPFAPLGSSRFVLAGSIGAGVWGAGSVRARQFENQGRIVQSELLLGIEGATPVGWLALHIGPAYFRERANDGAAHARWGVNLRLAWRRSLGEQLVLTGDLATGTAARDLWGRFAVGWRVLSWGFLGPEFSQWASSAGARSRAGAHLSDIPIGALRFEIAGGLETNARAHIGPYVALETYRNF